MLNALEGCQNAFYLQSSGDMSGPGRPGEHRQVHAGCGQIRGGSQGKEAVQPHHFLFITEGAGEGKG